MIQFYSKAALLGMLGAVLLFILYGAAIAGIGAVGNPVALLKIVAMMAVAGSLVGCGVAFARLQWARHRYRRFVEEQANSWNRSGVRL